MQSFFRKIFCLTVIFACTQKNVRAQPGYINTIAGTGVLGYSGDGGAAVDAKIGYTTQAALDAGGNIYIADNMHHVIRKISRSGIITTIAGTGVPGYSGDGGPATAAQFNQPQSIAVDISGNIYIGEEDNLVVRKIDASGIITTFAGNNIAGFSGDGGLATNASLLGVVSIDVDVSGNVYIVDQQNFRVRKITPAGIISTVAGTGVAGYNGDGITSTTAQLYWPSDVATDASGNLYIADNQNNRVRKVNSAGIISTVAGTGVPAMSGNGGPATAAGIKGAHNVSVDSYGNLYICENNRYIRKVNTSGIIDIFAGTDSIGYSGDGGLATSAKFNVPGKPLIDDEMNVYVPDFFNHRIRKINGSPTFITSVVTQELSVIAFPNPFMNEINLESTLEIKEVKVTNFAGYTVAQSTGNNSKNIKLNLDFLPDGIYNVSTNNSKGITVVKK
jgi:hypothetical protein